MAERKSSKSANAGESPSAALRAYALSLPGATEHFPWGERVAKVAKKVFVFLGHADADQATASAAKAKNIGTPGGISLSVKLPSSRDAVLSLPFAEPTGYGLGKSGWVTLRFAPGERVPVGLIQTWIEESYRAIAPRKQVALLPAPAAEAPAAVTGDGARRKGSSRRRR